MTVSYRIRSLVSTVSRRLVNASQRNHFLSSLLHLTVALVLSSSCRVSLAQTAHFSGAQTTVGNEFYEPIGVAVDGSGNLFVVDTDTFTIYELLANGGTVPSSPAIRTLIQSVSSNPQYVAVDQNGNVYFTDSGTSSNFQNNSIKEILAVNGSIPASPTVIQLGSGLFYPQGVAVDQHGNVFVADTENNEVKEMLAVNGSVPTSPTIVTLGSGFYFPEGVAVDGSGNVYVTDKGNFAVKEIVAVNGSIPASPTINTLVSGVCGPEGIALDSQADVYFAGGCDAEVFKILAVNGSIPLSPTIQPIGNGLIGPVDVAVDNQGDVYVGGGVNAPIPKISQYGGNFGSVSVGSSSSNLPMVFSFDSGGMLGSVSVVTQGAPGLDFSDSGTGTCQGGTSYSAGQTCTVNVIFKPRFPGIRHGAALLMDSSGNVIATGYLTGSGAGPQIGFLPGSSSSISSGFNTPTGEAVDGNGNIYVADYNNHAVKEIVAVDGSIILTLSSNFTYPIGVAVDGAGNVFVADSIAGTISEILPGGGGIPNSASMRTVASGFSNPFGIAVDDDGNVFVSDHVSNTISEILAMNGSIPSSPTIKVVASGFNQPTFLTIDGNNNIFVSDWGNNAVKEILAVNGSIPPSPTISTVATGLSNAMSLATDAAGNLLVANAGYNEIDELLAVNGTLPPSPQIIRLTDAFNEPWGLTLSADGNIFVADTGNNRIVKLDVSDPPSLFFASTNIGTTSSDSPQTVNLVNSGNADLSFPIPSSGNNPIISANFSLDSSNAVDCPLIGSGASEPGSLAPGAICLLPVSFNPLSGGQITGSLILTDDSLNSGDPYYASQTITLAGFGIAPGFTLSSAPSELSITQGKSATTTVTVTDVGGWTGKVKLTASGLPAGATASFGPDQAKTTSALTFSVGGNTPTGTFTIQVNGTSGSLSGSTAVALTVLPR